VDLKEALALSPEETESLRKLFSYRQKRTLSRDVLESLQPTQKDKATIRPYVRVNDLNNQNEQDNHNDNPTKRAIEIGIKGTF
jgi:hypothetical protein